MKDIHQARVRAIMATMMVLTALLAGPAMADEAAAPAAKSPAILYLATRENPKNSLHDMPVLARELYRQGLLIAARDGLGLSTRDQSLREWDKAPAADATWTFLADSQHPQITDGAGTEVWHEDFKSGRTPEQIVEQTAKIELLSRGKFVDLLKANGFSGSADVKKPDAAAPAGAIAKVDDLDDLSLFAVLRQMHALIRADGESEARLGVLTRAYANLGQLDRFHWSVDHEVFTARSLLYAQRMVAENPKSSLALWHRAYAMAMAGWQSQAMKDVAAAKQLGAGAAVPRWAALLDPFCRYDLAKLLDLASADPPRAPLAMYFAFLTVEHSSCLAATLNTEKAALQLNPRCLRVIAAMCDVTGPGLLNQLAEYGPQVFSNALGNELATTPGLPQPIVQKIAELRRPGGNSNGREILCQMLLEDGAPARDSAEPSWAVLGRDIQETTFAHIRRKADLIARKWGVDASGYVSDVQPLIAGHPFKGVVDAYGAEHELNLSHAVQAIQNVRLDDLDGSELPLYWLAFGLKTRGDHTGSKILAQILHNQESSFDSAAWIMLYEGALQSDEVREAIRRLRLSSPESPWLTCDDIVHHWDPKKAAEWEHTHGGYPTIQLVLSIKYEHLHQWEDAERCLRNYIKVSPDSAGYESLARLYKAQHRDDLWLATLKDFLVKTQPVSLEHAQAQSQIAYYYMDRGQFKEAIPFADEAAATAASWGLTCAARAHTGVGDFDRAEQLEIENYQHYSTSPYMWYAWCLRTGHGHRDAAARALADYFSSRGANLSSEDLLQKSFLDVLDGKKGEAVALMQKRFAEGPGPLSLLHVMVFADDAGDMQARDDAIAKAPNLHDPNGTLLHFARALARAYHAGPDAALDMKAIDALSLKGTPQDRIIIDYLMARYLNKQGHKDLARKYIERCYFGFGGYCAEDLLVDQLARDLGLNPMTLAYPDPRQIK